MSEATFQVGDEVEVLPCKEKGSLHELAHCQIAGRRGTVLIARDGDRSVGVHFPGLCGNNLFGKITTTTGWWCDPAWLRRVRFPRPDTAICPACKVVSVTAGPRYKVGDLVDMGPFSRGEVREVIAELTYMVRWPDGYEYSIKESTLSPHRPAPVVCAPDGTRCEQWQKLIEPARIFVGQTQVNQDAFRACPWCGGKLKED